MNVRYIRHLMHAQPTVVSAVVADSQTILVGDLVCIASGLVTKASASVHTGVFGIALDALTTTTHDSTSKINVLLLDEYSVIRMAYTGTAGNLVEANVFTTAYDLEGTGAAVTLHLDDTTGGFLVPVTLLDAVASGFVDVVVKASALWNA